MMLVARWTIAFHPRDHGRAAGQGFPATTKSAGTIRSRRINHLVSDLGVSMVDAAVKFAIKDEAATNACPNGYVNKPRFVSGCAPSTLSQRCRISIIFH